MKSKPHPKSIYEPTSRAFVIEPDNPTLRKENNDLKSEKAIWEQYEKDSGVVYDMLHSRMSELIDKMKNMHGAPPSHGGGNDNSNGNDIDYGGFFM
jgi:hypothetical protein